MKEIKNLNQLGFSHILIFIAVIVIPVIGFAGWRVMNVSQQNFNQSNSASQIRSDDDIPSCGQGPEFNTIPMELSDFRAFRPLGFVAIPIHIFGAKHSNFSINLPNEHVHGKSVLFPSDATVTNIVSTASTSGNGYQVTFYPCKEFKSYINHLESISEPLQKVFEVGEPKCQDFTFDQSGKITKCELATKIRVKSGDLIGASDSFGGVDWGAVDFRTSADYANLDRYDGDYPHYTSPILYLRADLKSKMLEKVGSYDGLVKRTVEPVVGILMQDKKGTAQGNWFIGDKSFKNTQDFSPFLALLHDYVDPTQPIFSMGTSVKGLNKGIYSFKVKNSGLINRDFASVKPDGQIYCYGEWLSGQTVGRLPLSTTNGVILLMMPDEKKLKVEYQTGSCSSTHTISDSATTFDR